MKIKEGFMLREIAGSWVVVPVGEKVVEFNGLMTLSESGALLWKKLVLESDENTLVEEILHRYEIDEITARTDVREFVSSIEAKGLIE